MREIEHIKELKNGSHKSFTHLYESYVSELYNFLYMLSKSNDTSKDITQDTFLKVWLNRQSIDETKSFKSFLFTIARNSMFNTFNKKVNQTVLLEDETNNISNSEIAAYDKLDLTSTMDSLKTAKSKLPPRQRLIFELSKEQELSIKEITALTSLSEQTVRNQLSTALKFLRKELGSQNLPIYLLVLTHVIKHV